MDHVLELVDPLFEPRKVRRVHRGERIELGDPVGRRPGQRRDDRHGGGLLGTWNLGRHGIGRGRRCGWGLVR
jgi:hypothetical protein